jgi:hypothetical protein
VAEAKNGINHVAIYRIPENHKTPLDYNRTFSKQEFDRIKLGDTPLSMDDHWFAFYENACLYIHHELLNGLCSEAVLFQ